MPKAASVHVPRRCRLAAPRIPGSQHAEPSPYPLPQGEGENWTPAMTV
jgi:hypothetical protein